MATVVVHAEKDEAQAQRIEDALHRAGRAVWRAGDLLVDPSKLDELGARLVDGTDVVVCLSPMALGLGLIHLVASAVTSARGRGDRIRLLPVLLEDCYLGSLPPAFGEPIQIADCRGDRFAGGARELAESLRSRGDPRDGDDLPRYLRSLREEHATLRLAGFVTRVRIPLRLSEVYVPLRARIHRPILASEHKTFGAEREIEALGVDEPRDVPFDEALRLADRHRHRGLVVLGDPGSGKTTLLKHLLLACTDPDSGPGALGLPPDTVPVLLQLRAFNNPAAGLDDALAEAVSQPAIGMPPDFARKLLQHGRLLVLVDGLDEVRTIAERAAVSRWLGDALTRLPDSRFVVTSRYAGYRGDAVLDGRFLELHVRSLEPEESRRFIEAWYLAVETQASLDRAPDVSRRIAEEQAHDLAEALFSPTDKRAERLRKLVENPLMLQIVCLVHCDRRRLPDRRVELYDECVRVLLGLWRDAKGIPSTYAVAEAFALLQPLAHWMQTSGIDQASAAALLPQLTSTLRELRRPAEEGATFLEAIRDQSGLLVSLGQDHYAFLHLSFQEYLAARHVQGQALQDPEAVRELAGRFGDDRFREVLLLSVGLDNPSLFEPLMDALIAAEALQRDVQLADDCLKDAVAAPARPFLGALVRGIPDATTRYHVLRLLRQLADWQGASMVLGDGTRVSAQTVVEEVARRDPDPQVRGLAIEMVKLPARKELVPAPGSQRVNPMDGTVLVYVPGGEFTLGAEDMDPELPEEWRKAAQPKHRVRLSAFWIAKVPVTNAQFAEFLRYHPEHPKPKYWSDRQLNAPEQPVVGVSWDDAAAYAAWARLRLPTEAQWEAAARGLEGRRYPWGNDGPTPQRANYGGIVGRTSVVGSYPKGAGRYGTLDQAGNVWEWCQDAWDAEAYAKRWGTQVDPVRVDADAVDRAVRGGSWVFNPRLLSAAFRYKFGANNRHRSVGFRCAAWAASNPGP